MNDLREYFSYDKESGKISRIKMKQGANLGEVKTKNSDGYIVVYHNRKTILGHRLAWWFEYGYFPKMLDHINRCRHDNRICNLREADHKLNASNLSLNKLNKTGKSGVHKRGDKYIVHANGYYVGIYNRLEEATVIRNKYHNNQEMLESLGDQNGRRTQSNNKSGYVGVRFNRKTNRWVAQIKALGKQKHIGSFLSCKEAVLAYNEYIDKHNLSNKKNLYYERKEKDANRN